MVTGKFVALYWIADKKRGIVKSNDVVEDGPTFTPVKVKFQKELHDAIKIAEGSRPECEKVLSDGFELLLSNVICQQRKVIAELNERNAETDAPTIEDFDERVRSSDLIQSAIKSLEVTQKKPG